MAEFFVARHYRREGVGRLAALQAIRPRPGRWEIAVARRNTGALAFWREVARSVSQQADERDVATDHWDGPVLRLVAP